MHHPKKADPSFRSLLFSELYFWQQSLHRRKLTWDIVHRKAWREEENWWKKYRKRVDNVKKTFLPVPTLLAYGFFDGQYPKYPMLASFDVKFVINIIHWREVSESKCSLFRVNHTLKKYLKCICYILVKKTIKFQTWLNWF